MLNEHLRMLTRDSATDIHSLTVAFRQHDFSRGRSECDHPRQQRSGGDCRMNLRRMRAAFAHKSRLIIRNEDRIIQCHGNLSQQCFGVHQTDLADMQTTLV
jgi:hypothetical protein